MGRGKIEIKKIENPTNRQVTFSKRRSGIMKKARELTVLCDAQVSVVILSATNKISEYCSPSTNIKNVYDRYQEATNTDLWSAQHERMQNNLNNLKEINLSLRKEIRQRTGGDLDGMDINELRGLEQNLETALKQVRGKKYHMLSTQTETYKKKFKNAQETHRNLLHIMEEMKDEQQMHGFLDDGYEGPLALALGGGEGAHSHTYAFRAQPDHQPNLHGVVMGYEAHDLHLG